MEVTLTSIINLSLQHSPMCVCQPHPVQLVFNIDPYSPTEPIWADNSDPLCWRLLMSPEV